MTSSIQDSSLIHELIVIKMVNSYTMQMKVYSVILATSKQTQVRNTNEMLAIRQSGQKCLRTNMRYVGWHWNQIL